MGEIFAFELESDELELFLQDVNEHLAALESGILNLEQLRLKNITDPDLLNAVFRAAHTLKAVAATVGHQRMAGLTHTMEALFDAMREKQMSPTPEVTDALLISVDALKALRDEVATRMPYAGDVEGLNARLRYLMRGEPVVAPVPGAAAPVSVVNGVDARLTPEQNAQIATARELGVPLLEFGVTVSADAFASSARLMQVGMAVLDAGEIIVQSPTQDDLVNAGFSGRQMWGILASESTPEELVVLLQEISELETVSAHVYAGSGEPSAAEPVAPAAAETPEEARAAEVSEVLTATAMAAAMPREDKTIRISVERLDNLMNLVGELVTDRTHLAQIESTLRAQFGKGEIITALDEMASHFGRVVDQLQEEVMQARMVPLLTLFNKFPRLVRDVARSAGKSVDLVIEGETTELDRSIIEAIGDPLVHLLRNAIDHGIEKPQERIAAGKSPTGTVRVSAEHAEGHIIITVSDDGGGISAMGLRRAAVRRGLFTEEEAAQLSDDEAIALIFQPTFSTAEQVTAVSGRGVGLDVVHTNVKRMGGSVIVETEVGKGTAFRVTLPLTLAIMQALLVHVGANVYAIPLTGIIESLYLEDEVVSSLRGVPVILWRRQALPLLYLRQFFAHPRLEALPDVRPAIVVVAWGKLRVGLIVDKLIGKQEIVIKSISPIVGNVAGLSGCAILGDGRVLLIIDVSSLISAAMQAQKQGGAA